MSPSSEEEYASIPHIIRTSDYSWDPSIQDVTPDPNQDNELTFVQFEEPRFESHGLYTRRAHVQLSIVIAVPKVQLNLSYRLHTIALPQYDVSAHYTKPIPVTPMYFEHLKPKLAGASIEVSRGS